VDAVDAAGGVAVCGVDAVAPALSVVDVCGVWVALGVGVSVGPFWAVYRK
jgi:hypothetical protein